MPGGLVKRFDRDLIAAGIATAERAGSKGRIQKRDQLGRGLDVHCLRHSFNSLLAAAGVPLTTRQILMRHAAQTVTDGRYTDATLIDLRGALDKLPLLPLDPNRPGAERLAATGTDGKSDADARFRVCCAVCSPADESATAGVIPDKSARNAQRTAAEARTADHQAAPIAETFMRLFIEGLARRDFEPALRRLAGSDTPLSPSTISRLTQQFRTAYTAFDRQDLSRWKFVYRWAAGIYLKAGLGTEKACLLVLMGADTEGQRHLIVLREGCRESAESWGELLKDGRQRGLNEPACWIADGALGLWAAVNEHSPHSAQQRCTNHKTMNVIDKLPTAEQAEATTRVRAIWQAAGEAAARKRAADGLAEDLERCLTFYQFPEAHWSHLRTTNVSESRFAGVRLRTNAAQRFKKTKSGV